VVQPAHLGELDKGECMDFEPDSGGSGHIVREA
jgi:hypothetical protein